MRMQTAAAQSPAAIPARDVTLRDPSEEDPQGGYGLLRFGTSAEHGPVVVKLPRISNAPHHRYSLVKELRAHVGIGAHAHLVRLLGFLVDMEDPSSFALSGGLLFERWDADCWDIIAALSPEGSGSRQGRYNADAVSARLFLTLQDAQHSRSQVHGHEQGVVRTLLGVLLGAGRGLQHLHTQGIVHGDLSPGNVLVRWSQADEGTGTKTDTKTDRAVQAAVHDLGMAVHESAGKEHCLNVRLDGGPVAEGTRYVFHMPLCGEHEPTMTRAFDIYSFGALIAALLTRYQRVPLEVLRMGVDQMYDVHVQRAGQHVLPGEAGCVHALLELAVWCLNTDPKSRPNVEQVLHYLEDVEACLC